METNLYFDKIKDKVFYDSHVIDYFFNVNTYMDINSYTIFDGKIITHKKILNVLNMILSYESNKQTPVFKIDNIIDYIKKCYDDDLDDEYKSIFIKLLCYGYIKQTE